MSLSIAIEGRSLTPSLLLFDVDGTLVDTNDLHAAAWMEVLHEYGYQASYLAVRRQVGKGGDKLLRSFAEVDIESPRGKRINERRREFFLATCLPKVVAFPAAHRLLMSLKGSAVKLGIATSGNLEELAKILEAGGLAGIFDEVTSADDASRSKPDPDIVQAALTRAGVAASEAVLIGDTPYDIEAGRRAGVEVIALGSGGWEQSSLGGAAQFFPDLAALHAAMTLS